MNGLADGSNSTDFEITGSLYRMNEGVQRVVEDVGTANGLAWNRNGDKMFFVDTGKKNVYVFDYDQTTATPSKKSPWKISVKIS